MINLRDYQDKAFNKIREVFRRAVLSVLLVIPTGGGKTVVFTYIALKASLKKKRTLILVHRVELLRQTSSALDKFHVEHGMVNPNYTPNYNSNVQVASIQTIINRLNYFAALGWVPDIIVVDEAHHATAGTWRRVIEHFKIMNPDLVVVGVTATPIRTDGQGLGKEHDGIFEEMVVGPSVKWLQDEGYLVRAKVLSPPKKFDSSKLRKRKGDYSIKDIESLVNKPEITGDAVGHYEQTCKGQPAIVFCATVKHTEEVAQEFRNRGYKFYAIDGTTDDDIRKRILNGLADGSVQGVCSCDLISEGTDVPAATAAVLLRSTGSLSLFLQQIGRVLRPVYADGYDLKTKEGRLAAIAASEKPFAFVLDHVGNVGSWIDGEFIENHGLPDKLHEWSLDGEVKKKRGKKAVEEEDVKVQQCLSCFAVHEPAPICPECGHVYERKEKKLEKVEGTLKEITPEMIAQAELKRQRRIEEGRAETLDDLKRIASERGYHEKWAEHRFNSRKRNVKPIKPIEPIKPIQKLDPFSDNLDF